MLKNDYYTIPIDKNIFLKIVEIIGVEKFSVKLYTTMFYDKENLEFSSVDFQYQYLSLKEIKDANESNKYICYTHIKSNWYFCLFLFFFYSLIFPCHYFF